MTSTLTVPQILEADFRDSAVTHLRRYFADVDAKTGWAGSRFERLAGGGDRPEVADRFTAEDVLAISLLSVNLRKPRGALQILEARADEFSRLLSEIPTDLELVDVDSIPADWAANRLWTAVRSVPGVGKVAASKLMARKRPWLIPVWDSVVEEAVKPTDSFWEALRVALRADDRALYKHLLSLRDDAEIGDDISPLRVFDVVVWMHHRYPVPADADAAAA